MIGTWIKALRAPTVDFESNCPVGPLQSYFYAGNALFVYHGLWRSLAVSVRQFGYGPGFLVNPSK